MAQGAFFFAPPLPFPARPGRKCDILLPVCGLTKPCKSMLQPHVYDSVSTAKHLKQNRVLQFRHIILWHSFRWVFCVSMLSFVIAIWQVGHCFVPVSSIHLRNNASLSG